MSSFGRVFRITTFGESHCPGVGVIVDGVPSGMRLLQDDIQLQLDRRRPGQSRLTTQRNEKDQVFIQSGVEDDVTLGTPISLFVANEDQKPSDYSGMKYIPRPSHADYTYQMKYGIRAKSGGGRSSARETIGRVAAGAIAELWLKEKLGLSIVAFVSRIGSVSLENDVDFFSTVSRKMIDQNLVRCPCSETALKMIAAIDDARLSKDSLGGIVTCVCRGLPPGLGEPVFDRLDALLAHAMLSIPATKGFEIGSGFDGTLLRGSAHNDAFELKTKSSTFPIELKTKTNQSGGVQGGISNGEDLYFRVAFKPTATIGIDQTTCDFDGEVTTLAAKGRHDPCVVPRAIPIVEGMAALVLADLLMLQQIRTSSF